MQHPTPPQPEVIWMSDDIARWTFDTKDREEQQRQFNYWCGWFGFDEDEQPYVVADEVWFFRHPFPNAPWVEVGDAEARAFLEMLKERPNPTPAEQAMIDELEQAWRAAAAKDRSS